MNIAELDDTTKGAIIGLLGFFGPKLWSMAKAIFDSPTAQEKKWDDHSKVHAEHTAEHGRVDGKFERLFKLCDDLKTENTDLKARIAHLEGFVESDAA